MNTIAQEINQHTATAKHAGTDDKIDHSELANLAKVPFIIGITGHRDIKAFTPEEGKSLDRSELQGHLQQLFIDWFYFINKITTDASQTKSYTPIRIMTGMAVGADMIAVDAALAARRFLKDKGWNEASIQIHGILPLPLSANKELLREDYKNVWADFLHEGYKNIWREIPCEDHKKAWTRVPRVDVKNARNEAIRDDFKDAWTELERLVKELDESPWDQLDELELLSSESNGVFKDVWEQVKPEGFTYINSPRNLQYVATGMLISNSCHLLVACWDEKVPIDVKDKLGGTSNVLLCKLGFTRWLTENRDVLTNCQGLIPSPLNGYEPGLVCHIKTDRIRIDKKNEFIERPKNLTPHHLLKLDGYDLLPPSQNKHENYWALATEKTDADNEKPNEKLAKTLEDHSKEWFKTIQSLRDINRDIDSWKKRNKGKVLNQYLSDDQWEFNPYLPDQNRKKRSSNDENQDTSNLLKDRLKSGTPNSWLFFAVDHAAKRYQTLFRCLILLPYFFISFVGLVFWEAYNIENHPLYLVGVLGALLGIGGVYLLSRFKRFKARYQQLRGLAEILRVKGYLNQGGVRAADELLPRSQRKDFPIHYYAVRFADIAAWSKPYVSQSEPEDTSQTESEEPIDTTSTRQRIQHNWINGQISFFKKRIKTRNNTKENKKKSNLFVWIKNPWKTMGTFMFDRPETVHKIICLLSPALFFIAIVAGLFLLAEPYCSWLPDPALCKIVIPVSLLLSATVKIWSSVNSLDHTVDNYGDMHWLMTQAYVAIDVADNNAPLGPYEKQMLIELGRSALLEHMLWTEVQRKNDIHSNEK